MKKMINPKHELKMLEQLKNIYEKPEAVIKANRFRQIVFIILSVTLMFTGMFLSKIGVTQGFCDILVCLSGVSFAYFVFYYSMRSSNEIISRYTDLDKELLNDRITELTKYSNKAE